MRRTDSATISVLLKKMRTEAGLSVRALAARVRKPDGNAISPSYITDIEKGRGVPSDFLLQQLAIALGDRADRWLEAARMSRRHRTAHP